MIYLERYILCACVYVVRLSGSLVLSRGQVKSSSHLPEESGFYSSGAGCSKVV